MYISSSPKLPGAEGWGTQTGCTMSWEIGSLPFPALPGAPVLHFYLYLKSLPLLLKSHIIKVFLFSALFGKFYLIFSRLIPSLTSNITLKFTSRAFLSTVCKVIFASSTTIAILCLDFSSYFSDDGLTAGILQGHFFLCPSTELY